MSISNSGHRKKVTAFEVQKFCDDPEVIKTLCEHSGWPEEKARVFIAQNSYINFHNLEPVKAQALEHFFRSKAIRVTIEDDAGSVIVTTSHSLEGHKITDYIGPVFAEYASGINVFRDMFAEARDFFGGRSKALQKELRTMQQYVIDELKKEAYSKGASAVIGVDFDYMEYREGMLILIANGTAVKIAERTG